MGVTFGNSEESVPLSIGRRMGAQLQRARMPGPLGNSLHSIISTDLQASLSTSQHQCSAISASHASSVQVLHSTGSTVLRHAWVCKHNSALPYAHENIQSNHRAGLLASRMLCAAPGMSLTFHEGSSCFWRFRWNDPGQA